MLNQSITLASCLNLELSAIVRREFANNRNARLLFSPSWESTCFFLARNPVDQVIVPSTLSESSLKQLTEYTSNKTSFIILGTRGSAQKLIRGTSGYFFKRREPYELIQTRIKTLGADVRNDLNNPLQEIVALAFVAKQTYDTSETACIVFAALENAALKMNSVVSGVETRIINDLIPASPSS